MDGIYNSDATTKFIVATQPNYSKFAPGQTLAWVNLVNIEIKELEELKQEGWVIFTLPNGERAAARAFALVKDGKVWPFRHLNDDWPWKRWAAILQCALLGAPSTTVPEWFRPYSHYETLTQNKHSCLCSLADCVVRK